jgi:hypothetical protein
MDLSLILDLPNLFSGKKLLIITSDDLNNSSFLIHSLIQQKARGLRTDQSSGPLFLILFNQSYSHYSSVAAKSFGINLKALKDDGRLIVIDVLKDLDQYSKSEDQGFFDIEKLSFQITELFSDEKANGTPTIIVDDISVLSCLGATSSDIYSFFLRLRNLSLTLRPASLFVQSSLYVSSAGDLNYETKEEYNWEQVLHAMIGSCDVYVQIKKLETGFSDKIDGSLFVHDFQQQSSFSNDISIKYHFKSAERSTRIFPPGSFSE